MIMMVTRASKKQLENVSSYFEHHDYIKEARE